MVVGCWLLVVGCWLLVKRVLREGNTTAGNLFSRWVVNKLPPARGYKPNGTRGFSLK
ncbi:MAG: hypothetical protein ACHBN1_24500 [Heteroscytonema crispum UTEX LB 1556]